MLPNLLRLQEHTGLPEPLVPAQSPASVAALTCWVKEETEEGVGEEGKGGGRRTEPQHKSVATAVLGESEDERRGQVQGKRKGAQPITEPESKLTKMTMYRNMQCRNLSLMGCCKVEGMSAVRKC